MFQMKKLVSISLILGGLGMLAFAPAVQAAFPADPNDDTTQSIAQFVIWVHPDFRSLVSNNTCYQSATKEFISPVMTDATTIVGRSASFLDGSPADTSSIVGLLNPLTFGDSSLTFPGVGFPEVPGTDEVHTKITRLVLTDQLGSPFKVRAGNHPDALMSSPRWLSPGEVQSIGGVGFPARSFFDIFVQVDTPWGILENETPLLVMNSSINTFPPQVIYIHGGTNAVPVKFKGGPNNGQIFGYLRLAGHGMDMPCCNGAIGTADLPRCRPPRCRENVDVETPDSANICPNGAALVRALATAEKMPCPECKALEIPALGPAGMAVLLLLLVGTGTILVLRRRRGASST